MKWEKRHPPKRATLYILTSEDKGRRSVLPLKWEKRYPPKRVTLYSFTAEDIERIPRGYYIITDGKNVYKVIR